MTFEVERYQRKDVFQQPEGLIQKTWWLSNQLTCFEYDKNADLLELIRDTKSPLDVKLAAET